MENYRKTVDHLQAPQLRGQNAEQQQDDPPEQPGRSAWALLDWGRVEPVKAGDHWTATQIDAIVKGGLWPTTVVFITWDDWGGWYDHVNPPLIEKWTDGSQFRFGSRVGCLVLSPYAKAGNISHTQHSHVSLVKFCETTFGLPTINARDKAADDMSDCFDFSQKLLSAPGAAL